jgi:hypothetical protein
VSDCKVTRESSEGSIIERVRHKAGVFNNGDSGTIANGHARSFLTTMLQRIQT